jgi:putative transposase
MKSKLVVIFFSDFGVAKSHSQPHVSKENPYSEAQFKALKYCPQFPDRFSAIQDVSVFSCDFFSYYNAVTTTPTTDTRGSS